MSLFLARPDCVGHFQKDGKTRMKIQALGVSPDGKRLATAGGDNKTKIWDIEAFSKNGSGDSLESTSLLWSGSTENETRVLQWSPDGHFLASGDAMGLVMLYTQQPHNQNGLYNSFDKDAKNNRETWKCIATFRGHNMDITGLSWAPGSNMVASSSIDNCIRIWSVREEMRTRSFNLIEADSIATLKGHSGWVMGVAWDPVGRYIASVGNNHVILWRCGDWKCETRIKGPFQEGECQDMRKFLSWSPDGVFLSMSHAYDEPRNVGYVIERNKWKDQESSVRLVGHSAPITCCSFSPCIYSHGAEKPKSTICAIACEKSTMTLWTPGHNRPLLILRKVFDRSKVQDMGWSGDGSVLIFCSSDGLIACLQCRSLQSHELIGSAISKAELTELLNEYYGEEDLRQSQPSIPETPLQFQLENRAKGVAEPATPSDVTTNGSPTQISNSHVNTLTSVSASSLASTGKPSQTEVVTANGKRRITPVALSSTQASMGTSTQPNVLVPRRRNEVVRPPSPLSARMPQGEVSSSLSGNGEQASSAMVSSTTLLSSPPSSTTIQNDTLVDTTSAPTGTGAVGAAKDNAITDTQLSEPRVAATPVPVSSRHSSLHRLVVVSKEDNINERDRILRSAKRGRVWATRCFHPQGSGQLKIQIRRVKTKPLFGQADTKAQGRMESLLTLSESAGKSSWTSTVRGRVCAAVSNDVFTACATRDNDLCLFGIAGEMLLPPIRLPARVANLASGGPGSPFLGCVTCDGRLRIWNVTTLTAMVMDVPLDPLWARLSSTRPRRMVLRSLVPAISRFTTDKSRGEGMGILAGLEDPKERNGPGSQEDDLSQDQELEETLDDDGDEDDDSSASEGEGIDDDSDADDAISENGVQDKAADTEDILATSTIAAFGLSPEGVAILIFAKDESFGYREECAAFAYEDKMHVWVRVADIEEFTNSEFYSTLSFSLNAQDAQVLASLRQTTLEVGREAGLSISEPHVRARELASLNRTTENFSKFTASRHAEALQNAAMVLQRPAEYKKWLGVYARQLASEGDEARLSALSHALLGSSKSASNSRLLDALSKSELASAWKPDMLGRQVNKRSLLSEVVVPAIASNRQLQQLATEISQALKNHSDSILNEPLSSSQQQTKRLRTDN